MTFDDLKEEEFSLNAIYPGCFTASEKECVYILSVPLAPHIHIGLYFPENYPEVMPKVMSISQDGGSQLAISNISLLQDVLSEIFRPGDVCVFEFIESLDEIIESDKNFSNNDLKNDVEASSQAPADDKKDNEINNHNNESSKNNDVTDNSDQDDLKEFSHAELEKAFSSLEIQPKLAKKMLNSLGHDPTEGWSRSEAITDRKSTFVGWAIEVHSVEEAEHRLEILKLDKKVARSSHNMMAYRIDLPNGGISQDYDDDGESAAGSRLLHLLTVCNTHNVMVVVCRWFGGVHIGPDRFKHISTAARNALEIGNFLPEESKKGSHKKKHKK